MDCEFVPQDIDTLGSGDHEEHRDLAEKANDSEVPKDLTTAQIFFSVDLPIDSHAKHLQTLTRFGDVGCCRFLQVSSIGWRG
jgi:hypothetical protein